MLRCLDAYGIYSIESSARISKNGQYPQVRYYGACRNLNRRKGDPAQWCISTHPAGYNLFNLERYSVSTDNYLYLCHVSLRPEKSNFFRANLSMPFNVFIISLCNTNTLVSVAPTALIQAIAIRGIPIIQPGANHILTRFSEGNHNPRRALASRY